MTLWTRCSCGHLAQEHNDPACGECSCQAYDGVELTPERTVARRLAREFAEHLKRERWAEPIPTSWKPYSDLVIKLAIDMLPRYGVIRRPDLKWEAASSY